MYQLVSRILENHVEDIGCDKFSLLLELLVDLMKDIDDPK